MLTGTRAFIDGAKALDLISVRVAYSRMPLGRGERHRQRIPAGGVLCLGDYAPRTGTVGHFAVTNKGLRTWRVRVGGRIMRLCNFVNDALINSTSAPVNVERHVVI